GPRRTEAETFKFSQKVLKSVGCAKVVGASSRGVEESTWCCVEFTISHSMEAKKSNGRIRMVDDSRCMLDLKSPERVMDY
ncbi:hypothetical protein Tco_0684816, partial [Tanacetum coccineum]